MSTFGSPLGSVRSYYAYEIESGPKTGGSSIGPVSYEAPKTGFLAPGIPGSAAFYGKSVDFSHGSKQLALAHDESGNVVDGVANDPTSDLARKLANGLRVLSILTPVGGVL